MKISSFIVVASTALVLSLAGCAGVGSKDSSPKGAAAKQVVDPSRSGGTWETSEVNPATDSGTPAPPAKLFNTDSVDLKAVRDPKAELKERAVERWALLIAQRGAEAFDYLSPGYQQTHERVKYGMEMSQRPVRWFRASFDHADCPSTDACEVSMLVDFKVRISAGMGVTESFAFITERWISVDSVWYHLPPDVGG